jgi:DNA-binding GntR family transcriptional regulator
MSLANSVHQEVLLSDDVYGRLKHYILGDAARPSEHIQMSQLSRHFGVSITPIREALIRLAGEQIIELRAGRGFFYKEFVPAEQIKIYEVLYCLLKYSLETRSDARQVQSPLPASSLPQISQQRESIASAAALAREAFYEGIVSGSGNEQFAELIRNLCERTRISRILATEQIAERDPSQPFQALREMDTLLRSGKNQEVQELLKDQFRAKSGAMYIFANTRQRKIYNAYPLLRPGPARQARIAKYGH